MRHSSFRRDTQDPDPLRRGEVAPALFYMGLRYDGSDGGTPDLELVERTTAVDERHLGDLCTLLAWHEQDPIDHGERLPNGVVFGWQDNRNPFVDHPDWVRSLWAGACG